jgi:hypothetical protein
MSTLDLTGKTILEDPDGLVRVDGITVFRKVERDGVMFIQFCDRDRMRAQCRGSKYVEIPLDVLIGKIKPAEDKPIEEAERKADG